jgi:O-antigen/teichoic acid export membrane protein
MKSDAAVKPSIYANSPAKQAPAIRGAREWFWLNVSSSLALTPVQAAVGLWLTPYLIGYLGIAAYGMVPLVNSLTSYLAVFTSAFTSSTSRFLTIDLGRSDAVNARRTFNTALFSVAGVCLALTPVALVISLVLPHLFDVPPGWESDTSWLFATVAIAFFLTVLGSIFALSPFAHNRFFMSNAVNLAALITRIGFIVTVFTLFTARLWYAGAGLLVVASVSLLGNILLWRKLTPELGIQLTAFDRTRLRSLMGLGGWVVVNQFGGMLLAGSDLVIVNLAFGAEATGGYGSILQISAMLQALVGTASTVVRPVILQRYAQADYAGLRRLSNQAVKLVGLALALPVGLLCGLARPFLSLWLGSPFQDLGVLLVLVIAHLSMNLSTRPLQYTLNAYNRVRWPGIVTLISGAVQVSLSALVAFWGGWGVLGVAVVTAVLWTARNALFIPWYAARIMRMPWWSCFPGLGAGVLGTLCVGFTASALVQVRMPGSWFALVSYATVVSLLYAGVLWAIGLSRLDKQLIKGLIPWHALRQDHSPKSQ